MSAQWFQGCNVCLADNNDKCVCETAGERLARGRREARLRKEAKKEAAQQRALYARQCRTAVQESLKPHCYQCYNSTRLIRFFHAIGEETILCEEHFNELCASQYVIY